MRVTPDDVPTVWENEEKDVPPIRPDASYDYISAYFLRTKDYVGYNNYYPEAEEPVPAPINMGSGGAANEPYNQPASTSASSINDEVATLRRFSIDTSFLSVEDDATTLIEIRGCVIGRLAC